VTSGDCIFHVEEALARATTRLTCPTRVSRANASMHVHRAERTDGPANKQERKREREREREREKDRCTVSDNRPSGTIKHANVTRRLNASCWYRRDKTSVSLSIPSSCRLILSLLFCSRTRCSSLLSRPGLSLFSPLFSSLLFSFLLCSRLPLPSASLHPALSVIVMSYFLRFHECRNSCVICLRSTTLHGLDCV